MQQIERSPAHAGAVRVAEIDTADLPGKELRDAWRWDGEVTIPLPEAKRVAFEAWWNQGRGVLRQLEEERAKVSAKIVAGLEDNAALAQLDAHTAQVNARLEAMPQAIKSARDEAALLAARPTWTLQMEARDGPRNP